MRREGERARRAEKGEKRRESHNPKNGILPSPSTSSPHPHASLRLVLLFLIRCSSPPPPPTLPFPARRRRRRRWGGRRIRGGGAVGRKPELAGETPRVVVVTSGKGGVGKTTTTANVGVSLARLGFSVVAVDADAGLRNLDLLLGLENRVNYTAAEVLNGDCRLDQALFVLIDCPAGIDAGFVTAISPANEAVLVTTPDITALRDADRVAGLLECDGIRDIKMLVNRVRSDLVRGEDMMSVLDVQDMLGLPLLGVIPEDAEVIRSTNRGCPLVLTRPPSLAGLAFEQAAWRLVEQDTMTAVMLEEEEPKKKGFFSFFGG
uniref:CobQ/CobB/MinD/ParA nucleotide binding domain-containing protein n=1 Tax=Ananas comosus var. bracteatus TaxID=296719 RepID=A0A6V7PJR6_ANACO|nr:unnamed protein product [Ananas comosus var. bracteatus]